MSLVYWTCRKIARSQAKSARAGSSLAEGEVALELINIYPLIANL